MHSRPSVRVDRQHVIWSGMVSWEIAQVKRGERGEKQRLPTIVLAAEAIARARDLTCLRAAVRGADGLDISAGHDKRGEERTDIRDWNEYEKMKKIEETRK